MTEGRRRSQGIAAERAGFADHFSATSVQYREARPAYPAALFHYLAVTCPATKSAWDCATGNGQAAIGLAERFVSVLATDPSPEMIAQAPPHPRVRYRVTKYDSGLPGRSVDLVTIAQALHWVDVDELMREVRRVLVPDGVFAAWCYSNCRVAPAIDEVFDHFYAVTLGAYWPAERRHVENGYQSIALPIDEMAAPPLQMVEEWSLGHYLGYIRTWSGLQKFVAARGEAPVLEFEQQVKALWGGDALRRTVRWPLHWRIGQIR
ncbi:MAG TPA: class I SAM-dependent methyltransferase [Gemmatimonadaceae bacterium]|nr:class I SAM-dependent methyltransferase [Gemmatimonadaceae bacterium]